VAQSYPAFRGSNPAVRPVQVLACAGMDDTFAFAIQDHLELQRRNRPLEPQMPLSGYRDPRAAPALEDTQEWVMPDSPAVLEHEPEPLFTPAEELWTGTPAFDWGD
jgi:hypothetical protein